MTSCQQAQILSPHFSADIHTHMQIRQWVNRAWSERGVPVLIQRIGLPRSDTRTYGTRLTFAKRFCLQKYCKVNRSDLSLPLALPLSLSLSLWCCIIVRERAGAAGQITIQLKAQKTLLYLCLPLLFAQFTTPPPSPQSPLMTATRVTHHRVFFYNLHQRPRKENKEACGDKKFEVC